jgi:hypothetical protein
MTKTILLTAITGFLALTSILTPAQAGQHVRGHGYGYGRGHVVHYNTYRKPTYFSYGHHNHGHNHGYQPRHYKTCAKWAYGHCLKWY